MRDSIGEIMRKIRVSKNYSQEFVAERVGVEVTTYSRYESGRTQPRFEVIVLLAELYKMTLDDLQHYGDPNFKASEVGVEYIRNKSKVSVLVELDGLQTTLDNWVTKLTAINQVL